MTTEMKRDLAADLAFAVECQRSEAGLLAWEYESFEVATHAIRRALAAEEKWAKLRSVVVTNATGGGGENINDYDIMLNVMNDIDTEVSENAET